MGCSDRGTLRNRTEVQPPDFSKAIFHLKFSLNDSFCTGEFTFQGMKYLKPTHLYVI